MQSLDSKYKRYLELIKTVQDKHGFIESHECDSLLFSALAGCVPGVQVGIYAAHNRNNNTWHRRPLSAGSCCDCWDPKRPENQVPFSTKLKAAAKHICATKKIDSSELNRILAYKGSTISRDMLLGLAWYAWRNKRLDISESVIKCAMSNWGVMGEGDPFRINIMPPLFATFCWISYRLGGPSRAWARGISVGSGGSLTDYKAHLQVLHILLRQELVGYVKKDDTLVLQKHATREPNNPLFQYAVGNKAKAEELLLNEDFWPSDRLPTRADRKTQWIPMRDEGEDWAPAKEDKNHKHSGADFLFVAYLLRGPSWKPMT